jgi:hypothetical protein
MTIEDQHDPEFLTWLRANEQKPIRPDREDYDRTADLCRETEHAREYRLAQARKLLRLYRVWRAERSEA